MLEITDEALDEVWICHLEGRLDGSTSGAADKHLTALGDDPKAGSVILDCSKLDYMSSAGLRVLLMAAKRAKNNAGRLALASPQEGVKQVLEISGFTSILDIHPSREEAIKALSS